MDTKVDSSVCCMISIMVCMMPFGPSSLLSTHHKPCTAHTHRRTYTHPYPHRHTWDEGGSKRARNERNNAREDTHTHTQRVGTRKRRPCNRAGTHPSTPTVLALQQDTLSLRGCAKPYRNCTTRKVCQPVSHKERCVESSYHRVWGGVHDSCLFVEPGIAPLQHA